ncbi:hypothetical protein CVA86_RS21745 [Vibrio parahaemolyticus]|nr:hypothetical protein [Vibrio parahaemolyticus]
MEKAKILINAIATVVIPLVIAFIGHQYTVALKDKDVQLRFVELSIGVLSEEPTKDNQALRTWAARVVDKYSGVEFTKEELESIVNTVKFPTPRYSLFNRSVGSTLVVSEPSIDSAFDKSKHVCTVAANTPIRKLAETANSPNGMQWQKVLITAGECKGKYGWVPFEVIETEN